MNQDSIFGKIPGDVIEEAVSEQVDGWSYQDMLEERAEPLDLFGFDEDDLVSFGDDGEDLFGDDGEDLFGDEGEESFGGGIFSSGAGALEDEDEDEDEDQDDLSPMDLLDRDLASKKGRVAMANRVRLRSEGRLSTNDTYGVAYAKGYTDALVHQGLEPEEGTEVFGIWAALAGLVANEVVVPLARGASDGKSDNFFENLGKGIGQKLGTRSKNKPHRAHTASKTPALPQADHYELPPVYVADTAGFKESVSSDQAASGPVATGLPIEERFGEVVRYGFIGKQTRAGSRRAADLAVQDGSAQLRVTTPTQGAVFVEDPGALPVLFSDGSVADTMYGALATVPCPSCSAVHAGAVQQGHAAACQVCDGHGAVLVPSTDLSSWTGVRYGILLEGIALLGDAIYKAAKKKPKKKKKKSKKKAHKKTTPTSSSSAQTDEQILLASREGEDGGSTGGAGIFSEDLGTTKGSSSSMDEDEGGGEDTSADEEESMGATSRAIVPRRWWEAQYGKIG